MFTNIDLYQYIRRSLIMSRIQLALNVSNLESAIAFYSQLFGVEPAKHRPGYANFAISEPPLKLVLMENLEATNRLNHLGIEVETAEEVKVASDRLQKAGLAVDTEDNVTCCYALQDKVWVRDPDGAGWEVYTVLEDSATFGGDRKSAAPVCCA
jgi:catechol 2,3-dioxygenase-like lactoylglutathione lyase family enzyme